MKSAAKRAASEALVQILAVTAVLVFAEFIFYSRKLGACPGNGLGIK